MHKMRSLSTIAEKSEVFEHSVLSNNKIKEHSSFLFQGSRYYMNKKHSLGSTLGIDKEFNKESLTDKMKILHPQSSIKPPSMKGRVK